MKNIIKIKLDDEHCFNCSGEILARQNENRATALKICLTEEMLDKTPYIEFEKPDGTKVITPKLDIDIENKQVIYEITNALTDQVGDIKVEITLRDSNNLVWKSFCKKYIIVASINADKEVEEENPDFISNAQKVVDQANNLDIEAEKLEDITTIKVTKKDGEEQTVTIPDGKDYVLTDDDKKVISDLTVPKVEAHIQPTLSNNLKEAKDYTDNAIVRDFKDITFNETTMTFVFTRHDNTITTVDLPIEQTVKNGYYDAENKELALVLVSGQEIRIPASGLISDYDGVDSATIQCVVSADNKITCNIIAGSITKTLLTTELQEEINGKLNKSEIGEEVFEITYEDGSFKTVRSVVFK